MDIADDSVAGGMVRGLLAVCGLNTTGYGHSSLARFLALLLRCQPVIQRTEIVKTSAATFHGCVLLSEKTYGLTARLRTFSNTIAGVCCVELSTACSLVRRACWFSRKWHNSWW